ncbi:MAG TPA: PQQ-binding-like beta-propeller repeat protein [Vicinamibacterales bacterium]|jgi:outer membrane protein assembly factor BamB
MDPTSRKPLRLWPGVAAAALMIVLRVVVPIVAPDMGLYAAIGGLICSLTILLWWLFFSRAAWIDRIAGILLMVVAVAAMFPVVDVSIRTGMMGRMFPVYSLFVLPPALAAWALFTRRLANGPRRLLLVVVMFLAAGSFALVRTEGIRGGQADLTWRWTKTPEERLLAQPAPTPLVTESAAKEPAPPPATEKPAEPTPVKAADSGAATPAPAVIAKDPEWPGFRGRGRDAIVRNVRIATDWSAAPPKQMWRRQIGPGWSSFAISGDLLYTQEQRGEEEIVTCYKVSTGDLVWRHADKARFWESNAGPGPRGTPALSNGRVYTFGATGLVNALDAATGAVVWSRNAATDANKQLPMWGFTSSPLVVDDLVVVAVSGKLAAYDIATGKPRWLGPARPGSYSSPHLVTIDGVRQIVLLNGAGATSVGLDGAPLWDHAWEGATPIVQPAMTPDGDLLINAIVSTGGLGIRRLHVTRGADGWTAKELWTSTGLKPYFNDFVIHNGHAYGFDGSILSCIDLGNGQRKWKGGRYGEGQLVLLPEQDLLLVSSEEGELALVKAMPDQFTEVARFKAIEGKTWNHPALAGTVLLVRNGEEMAAFRLASAGR